MTGQQKATANKNYMSEIITYDKVFYSRIYGKKILKDLSKKLTKEFGKGFSEDNLSNMRKLYLTYQPQISETLSRKFEIIEIQPLNIFKLSWSHYLKLMRIEDERKFYEIECAKNNWSLREMKRKLS